MYEAHLAGCVEHRARCTRFALASSSPSAKDERACDEAMTIESFMTQSSWCDF